MRTSRQINNEIKALRKLKPTGPFAADTAEKIKLSIEELEYGVDQTAGEWSELNGSERDIVQATKDWKEGYSKSRPSEGWEALTK